ncbi:Rieske 2Fe-2S domain-containing protein [Xanthomonas protegens]|uniref:Rieske 2Fe-2S domain-containing protein n=2 Tax=Xanthomonas TaxID=338 RepID=A0ABU9LFK2_9XANT
MSAWHPSLYRQWFAVAPATALRRQPLAVSVMDRHAAIARCADGGLLALEDRCPHRHAPLSAGCATGDGLSCPYHGWRFDRTGALREIPGLPPGQAPPAVRVRAFAAREHDGLIWLRPDPEGADTPSQLVQALQPSARRFLWRTRWEAHVVDALENFLDPLHTHLLHPGLVRRGGARTAMRAELRHTDEGFHVDYRGAAAQSGWLYRLFESPRILERAHFAGPGSAQIEYRYARGGRVRISLHFTPLDVRSTDVFASLHVEGRWAPAWAVRLLVWPLLRRVGEQDRRMLALQSRNLQRYPGARGASTALDLVREPLRRYWDGEPLPAAGSGHDVELML